VKRREFITLPGGAAARSLAAHAQQRAMPVIGFLNSASAESFCTIRGRVHGGSRAPSPGDFSRAPRDSPQISGRVWLAGKLLSAVTRSQVSSQLEDQIR